MKKLIIFCSILIIAITNYEIRITKNDSANTESAITKDGLRITESDSDSAITESAITKGGLRSTRDDESRVTKDESRITRNESRVTRDESRITRNESRITKHEKNMKMIENCPVDTMPTTKDDARKLAVEINRYCRILIKKNDFDSLYLYAKKGISVYENSSLFFLKAKALYHLKQYNESIEACQIAYSKSNYWNKEDEKKTVKIELDCMIEINRIYPIRQNKKRISELEKKYETFN